MGPSAPAASNRSRSSSREPVGTLPPEVIQGVVRQSFGRFRLCYEQGLARDATLHGRVAVRFVIGLTGEVIRAENAGSDLPDEAVVDCVVRGFVPIVFPPPEGGFVTVVYPISFAPGG